MTLFKLALAGATALTLISGTASAQDAAARTFLNPCVRGPFPEVRVINNPRTSFIAFIQGLRPSMPLYIAQDIAFELCDDLSLINNDPALTQRLGVLVRNRGY
jgi:hypothetical protein